METISRHAEKYRTEKYYKNKLIKNFTYSALGKKSEFKCSPQRASNVKRQLVRGLLGGSGGMVPPKFGKLDTLDWLKLTFLHEKCDKTQSCSQHIYTKVVQKRITPQACFTNSRLQNKKFTALRTEIDSLTYHDQTFNHDITHKIHSRFHVKK